MLRQTYTLVDLPVPDGFYHLVRNALESAGYHHAIDSDGRLDMSGIALTNEDADCEDEDEADNR